MNEVVSASEREAVRRYYRSPAVRERVLDFCGGGDPGCEYWVGFGEALVRRGYLRPIRLVETTAGLAELMEDALDLNRSVWDKHSTLAVWDVEYFNLDTWDGLYRNQNEYFGLMEPTYLAIESLLKHYGIPHLNDCTASGYHFVSRIPFASPVHARLEKIGILEKSLSDKYSIVPGGDNKRQRPVPERDGRGYSAIGRLTEFLCHRVIREAQKSSPLVIAVSDTARRRTERGREGMNLDITQYGDPIYMRTIRTSFSTHQKHKVYVGKVAIETARSIPFFASIPRDGFTYRDLFEIRRDLKQAAQYAPRAAAGIPDAARGWGKVLDDYLTSDLYAFHREFDSVELEPPHRWGDTYWELDLNSLPACVAGALRNPSWGLLVPTSIETICRVLFSYGWHPKHIGGLLYSHYTQNHPWKTDWKKYHAETRANFWARLYCGLIVTGTDTLADLNCISHTEKGFCPSPWCGHNLKDCADAIRRRIR